MSVTITLFLPTNKRQRHVLYLSVKRATGLLVFLYYFALPSLNKAITYLHIPLISQNLVFLI